MRASGWQTSNIFFHKSTRQTLFNFCGPTSLLQHRVRQSSVRITFIYFSLNIYYNKIYYRPMAHGTKKLNVSEMAANRSNDILVHFKMNKNNCRFAMLFVHIYEKIRKKYALFWLQRHRFLYWGAHSQNQVYLIFYTF